jgi:rare lipoprotein A
MLAKAESYHSGSFRVKIALRMSFGRILLVAMVVGTALHCGGKPRIQLPPPLPATIGFIETGVASWYGHPYHGRTTSNGETYDMEEMTAAHLQLPFGTVVRVTNLDSKKSVEVRINDRGPFVKKRIIDLSQAAARQIDMIGSGTAEVRVEVVSAPGGLLSPLVDRETLISESVPCGAGPFYGAQVGSFTDRDNAERLRGKMAHDYGESYVVAAASGTGDTVYRVVVGAAGRTAELDSVRKKLAGDGIDSFVQRVAANDAQACT